MKTIKLILLSAAVLLLVACKFNMTYKNREADKQAAEQVLTRLYICLENKDYKSADTLFSKEFYSVTTKDKLNEIFAMTDNKLGDIQDTNITEWQTEVVTGTDPSTDYVFQYANKYKYYEGQVLIHLRKDPDGKIRIVGYRIKSDGFDDK
jgi:hypothetical protein